MEKNSDPGSETRESGINISDHIFESFMTSVADPGCLSRILIFTHSESRISDQKTVTKERVDKKLVVIPFFGATNFTKLKIILFLKC
jgi:hypothetical protein